ncbi:MAG: MFS transporter, partial [Betaproteobacteria bacterium]|nr:MFS transporter [Betaproteobacteria bacterium]
RVQIALCVLATLLTLFTAFDRMTLALLGVFAFAQGVLSAVEVTTRHSIFAELIDDQADLPNAIALNSVNINGTRLAGPALGGLLIAWAGEAPCFGLNALSYLAVVVQLQRIAPRESPRKQQSAPFLAGLAEGWRHAASSPVVWPLVLIVGAVSFTINPYTVLMPAIAVQTFARGAEMHGLFVTAVGAGALVGALLLARRESVRGLAGYIQLTAACAALGAIGFSFAAPMRSVELSVLCMALLGFGLMGTSASVNTIVQTVTDDHLRGRVVSVYSTFFTGAVPIGHLCAGWVAERFGAPRTFTLAGMLCALAAVIYALNLARLRRHLREQYTARGIIPRDPPTEAR